MKINYSKCKQCFACVNTFPEHFKESFGLIEIKGTPPKEVKNVCPNNAIEEEECCH